MKSVIVRLHHARSLGYCSRGMRRWVNGKNYSWHEFVENGVPSLWLRESGDDMAIRVAEFAEKMEMEQGEK